MDALALLSDDEDGPPEDDVEEATEPETKRQKTPQLDFAALQRVGFASGTSELDEDVAAAASLSNSVPSMQRATKSDSTGLPKGQGILGLSHKHTTPSMPCGSNLTSAKKSSAGCVPIQSQTVHFVPRSPRQPHRAAASCRRNRLFSPGMVSSFPCPRRLSMVSADQGCKVIVHAVGVLQRTGKTFRSSRDDPRSPHLFLFGAGKKVVGWEQGCLGMRIGETRKLHIPSHEGYGA